MIHSWLCFYSWKKSLTNFFHHQESLESPVPQLVALESSSIDFVNDLESLDRLSPRSADTVHVFYMKAGQKGAEEILNNVVRTICKTICSIFFNFSFFVILPWTQLHQPFGANAWQLIILFLCSKLRVNFINVQRAAFTVQIPKLPKA